MTLGFEHRASYVSWATPSMWSFYSCCFGDMILLLAQLCWAMILLFYAFHCSWDDRWAPQCPAFFHWDGVSKSFFTQAGREPTFFSSQTPTSLGCRHIPVCPVIDWDEVLLTVPWLALASLLMISAFHVARITGMSHLHMAKSG
jgi:hypothetical protein